MISAADPRHAGATHVLGLIANDRGQVDEAISLISRAIQSDPKSAFAHNNLGVILCTTGDFDAGIAAYKRAIAIKPDYPVALSNLGAALTNKNMPDESVAQCKRAILLAPDYPEAHYNLASALHLLGKSSDARAHFEKAVTLNPNYADAQFARCMVELPILFADEVEITQKRASYEQRLRVLVNDRHLQSAALADGVGSAQPFQLAYQGRNDLELQKLYGSFICELMAAKFPPIKLSQFASAGEQVRVGIVSGYFRQHSNWKIPIKGWLSQLDRKRFKIFGYHTGVIRDAQTAVAAGLCERFVQGPLSIEKWRKEIEADLPHVLIYPEVGINPVAVKLAAQRLAPVQCNSWGHPDTSGMPTLDYYLSSELMEPPDGDEHYSEQLIRLRNLSIFYELTSIQGARITRADLQLRSSATVFWCGQSLFKYLPQFDRVYPQIARDIQNCQFVFVHFPAGENIKALFYKRLDRAFRENGLDWRDYCVMLPQLDAGSFSAAISQCDVFLNSIGWSGCNSTLESLEHDLPIVTMPGTLMRGRHTAAILTMMDVTQTIATSVDDYIAIASRLAKDHAWRMEIKDAISRQKHQLYADRSCVAGLENFLLQATQAKRVNFSQGVGN